MELQSDGKEELQAGEEPRSHREQLLNHKTRPVSDCDDGPMKHKRPPLSANKLVRLVLYFND